MKLATAAQMKELDRQAIGEAGIPSMDLMEQAALGVARAALELLEEKPSKSRVAVFCGSGNNGGDGIAAARLLFLAGVKVRAFLVGNYEKLTPDAMEETRRLSECGVELEPFDPEDGKQAAYAHSCHVLIDAVFGVGLSRTIAPESKFAAAIRLMNACPGKVVAADIASGVEADTGRILGCAAMADKTISFTLKKPGQILGEGGSCSGEVVVWDIGIPKERVDRAPCRVQTMEADFLREALPKRQANGHKGTFGKVLVVGGAVGYTGAPYLTATAAVRSGCGLVFLGVPECIWPIEAAKSTCAMPFPLPEQQGMLSYNALQKIEEKLTFCDVLALGPGLGRSEEITALVCDLLRKTEKPIVLDADGINALSGHMDVLEARRGRVTILTPHDGEFARMGGDLTGGDRIGAARRFAQDYGCTLVLKGHRTLVATPRGNVLVNITGNSGLARGGSGDVLTGIIASLLAQGATAVQAAGLGVWLHGRSGDVAAEQFTPYAMTPEDVIASLGAAFGELMQV